MYKMFQLGTMFLIKWTKLFGALAAMPREQSPFEERYHYHSPSTFARGFPLRGLVPQTRKAAAE